LEKACIEVGQREYRWRIGEGSAESCENGENMRKYITRRKEGVCKETESMEDGENRMLELVRGWKENGMEVGGPGMVAVWRIKV
jgi:hypothetical protein